jgi:hypothetical protein
MTGNTTRRLAALSLLASLSSATHQPAFAEYEPQLESAYPYTSLPTPAGTVPLPLDMAADPGGRVFVLLAFLTPPATIHSVTLSRLHPSGALDTGFGNAGSATLPVAVSYPMKGDIVDIDGSGRAFMSFGPLPTETLVVTSAGSIDTSFDGDGRAQWRTIAVNDDGSSWVSNSAGLSERRRPDGGLPSGGFITVPTTTLWDIGEDWMVTCNNDAVGGSCGRVNPDGTTTVLLDMHGTMTPFIRSDLPPRRHPDGRYAFIATDLISDTLATSNPKRVLLVNLSTGATQVAMETRRETYDVAFTTTGAFYTVTLGQFGRTIGRHDSQGNVDPTFVEPTIYQDIRTVHALGEHAIAEKSDGTSVYGPKPTPGPTIVYNNTRGYAARVVTPAGLFSLVGSDIVGTAVVGRFSLSKAAFTAGDTRLVDTRPGRVGTLEQPGGIIGTDVALPLAADTPVRYRIGQANGGGTAASGSAINATVVGPPANGYLSVYPCASEATAPPATSTLNYRAGRTTGNSTIVSSALGGICVLSSQPVHVVLDLSGSVSDEFSALSSPRRLIDSRAGLLGELERGTGDIGRELAGWADTFFLRLPAELNATPGRGAMAINVTAVGASQNGFVSVFGCDERGSGSLPATSTVNITPGGATGNSAVVRPGVGGLCVTASTRLHVIVDVTGTFAPASFVPYGAGGPTRLLDTRPGLLGALEAPVNGGQDISVPFTSGRPQRFITAGETSNPFTGLAINATIVAPPGGGYLTVYACDSVDTPPPVVSTVNYAAGVTTSGSGLVGLSNRAFCVVSSQPAHVVLDATGYAV